MPNRLKLLIVFIISISTISCMAQNNEPKTFLALGDSYTIGESVEENERWPVQLVAQLNDRGVAFSAPKIIAKTGWRTDELKEAIIDDFSLADSYDMVSLLIGVNNQYQQRPVEDYESDFENLIKKAIELAGDNAESVFVVSIPDYGKTPFGSSKAEEIRREINLYNKINKRISKKYKVQYFNITPISRKADTQPELIASDELHPSAQMYREWVDLMIDDVTKMMKK